LTTSSSHTNQIKYKVFQIIKRVGGLSTLSFLSTVEKFILTSSNSSSIYPEALYFYYKNTSNNFSDCSNIPGMTFDSNNGRFTGTPTEQNLYKVYITANNGTSKRRSSFSLSSFKTPTSFSFQDSAPTIRASGTLIGDKITLYGNSSCSSSLGSNAVPNSSDGYVDIEISAPSNNTTLYYKKTTPQGMQGSCVTTGLTFSSVTAPSLTRDSSLSEYDNDNTVIINANLTWPNGSGSISNVKIYKDSSCSSNHLVASHRRTPSTSSIQFQIDLSS
jgi:hypothetical protein